MPLYVNNQQDKINLPPGLAEVLQELMAAIQKEENLVPDAEISLTLVDDATIQELNSKYRGIDAPTDVLSFPQQEKSNDEPVPAAGAGVILGDVIIATETAVRQAQEYGHSLWREIGLLAVHGILHLLGYDHQTQEDLRDMEARQEKFLQQVGLSPAVPGPAQLVELAATISKNAYAPYSGLAVGAALLGASGEIYLGCNVENASYGLSICAERAAAVQAVTAGEREFRALALMVGDGQRSYLPCGACRQFLSEFGDPVIITRTPAGLEEYRLADLLPRPFSC